jgi:hypothetical protein
MPAEHATINCPYCEAKLDLRVEMRAAVAPPLRLHFDSPAAFDKWLHASGLTPEQFESLPIYAWYRDEFDPLLIALREP